MAGESADRRYGDLAVYRRLLKDVRPYRRHVAGTLCLSLLASPLVLLTPVPIQMVVDNVIGGRPVSDFFDTWLPAAATESGPGVLIVYVGLFLVIGLIAYLQVLGAGVCRLTRARGSSWGTLFENVTSEAGNGDPQQPGSPGGAPTAGGATALRVGSRLVSETTPRWPRAHRAGNQAPQAPATSVWRADRTRALEPVGEAPSSLLGLPE